MDGDTTTSTQTMGGLRTAVRDRIVDGSGSLGARARQLRWQAFHDRFPDVASMRVLDLGGTVEWWRRAPVQPASVTVVNLFEVEPTSDERFRSVQGDACTATRTLTEHGLDTEYDLVFSNSLLEHVGGHARRSELAGEIRRLAPRHWVQTPYRYFPVEPHWLFPGFQFLPVSARASVATWWPLQHTRPSSADEALTEVQWVELVGQRELAAYFPDSTILPERLAGLTKSLTAVRTG